MAGRGPNGLNAVVQLQADQKCPAAPTKRRYPTAQSAQEAAVWRTRESGIKIEAYACPDCGYYHLSRSSRLDRVLSSEGRIVTTGLAHVESLARKPEPVKRVDMSELLAAETPIVPGNDAALEKMLAEYLTDKTEVTLPDVMEAMMAPREKTRVAMHALGWRGQRGRKEWFPPGVELPGPASKSGQRRATLRSSQTSKGGGSRAEKLFRQRKRKLKAYLQEREEVSTREVQELLGSGKEQARALLQDAGWQLGGAGFNARWRPTDASQPQQDEITEDTERVTVHEPIDLASRLPVESSWPPPPVVAVAAEDLGWRSIAGDDPRLRIMSLADMLETLAPFGFEVRIQIREIR